jgi:4-amino-4-deoxychorismate lyase
VNRIADDKNKVIADDGFFFSLGVFETIAVENGKPLLLEKHLKRMSEGLKVLGIQNEEAASLSEKAVTDYLEHHFMEHGVLKITATQENLLWSTRDNHYSETDYQRGFSVDFCDARRNETSLFTYIKSLSYGDCILEKRKAKDRGVDEPLFLNSRGYLTEGATTNIFLVKNGRLYTPCCACGLLNGTVRQWIMERYEVTEAEIRAEELNEYEELFLTNALLGIMPVSRCMGEEKTEHGMAERIRKEYKD